MDNQTKRRVAASTLAVWVAFVGIFYLHLFITEQVARDILLTNTIWMRIWTVFGIMGTVSVLGGVLLVFIPYYCELNLLQSMGSAIVLFIMMFIITFFPPFDMGFRGQKLAEDGLIGDYPYPIHCMGPSKLTLPASHSYFTLEDPEWNLDWSRRKRTHGRGLQFNVVPIVYNGTGVGCEFDPPLWAVSVSYYVHVRPKIENTSIPMRKLHSIHYIDTEWKDRLKELVDADYMVEFNSPTMSDVRDFVEEIKEEKAELYFISVMVFAGVTFLILICSICQSYIAVVCEPRHTTALTSSYPTTPLENPLLGSDITTPPPDPVMSGNIYHF